MPPSRGSITAPDLAINGAGVAVRMAAMDPGRRGLTAAEIVTRLRDADAVPEWQADMRAAVEELCGRLDARQLGYKFRHFARRTFAGRVLDATGKGGTKTNRWAVFDAGPPRAGPSPSSPSSPGPWDAEEGDEGDEGDDPDGAGDAGGVWHPTDGRLFGDYRDSLPPD